MITYSAYLSDDGVYRYSLHRIWDRSKPPCLFIMLNPSTADECKDDATVRRCMRFASDWGYGSLSVGNLFAFRSRNPQDLRKATDPIGPENDDILKSLSRTAGVTVCAWGRLGSFKSRDKEVLKILVEPHYLEWTLKGQPKHPLYLRSDSYPKPMERIDPYANRS